MYQVLPDGQGNVLIADRTNHQVVQVSAGGILTIVAGNGIDGFSGDGGPATRASLSFPSALARDTAGNLFISDAGNYRIRRVSAEGVITTYAGSGREGSAGDGGPALAAEMRSVQGLAVDGSGNLYLSDASLHRVRRVNGSGIITNFAGDGQARFGGDGGQATQASLREPKHLFIDRAGNLLIADSRNHRVRSVNGQGVIRTIAGRGEAISDGDGGSALQAGLIGPTSAFMDGAGNLFISEFFDRVRVVLPNGIIGTYAGGSRRGFSGDGGQAKSAQLSVITSVAGDASGNVYIADSLNLRVRRVDGLGIISTFAGVGQNRFSGDGGPAVSASFALPTGLTVDRQGNIYIADSENHRIRRVSATGIITTYAGNGNAGFSGDGGPASQATLNYPLGLALDSLGNLYIADQLNLRVRRITPNGIISTVAGGGQQVTPVDGTLASQVSMAPASLAVDSIGNLYILDPPSCVIFRVSPDGRVSRFAGRYLTCGSSGDNGPAQNATIHPEGALLGGIALDSAGNVYLAEPNAPDGAAADAGGRVRMINRAGNIVAFAGNGKQGIAGDLDLAAGTRLFAPTSVTTDPFGGVYIGDTAFIYGVAGGLIIRLAGDILAPTLGDGGPARNAYLFGPAALSFDPTGNLLFLDSLNRRIRAILINQPTAAVSPVLVQFQGESGGAPAPPQNLSLTASIPGVGYQIRITPASASWLSVTPSTGTSPRLIQVTADPARLSPGQYFAEIILETPFATPGMRTVPVTFVVGPAVPPRLSLDKAHLPFSFPAGAVPRTQAVLVSNTGGGTLDFTVSFRATGGWLAVSPTTGQARPGQPVAIGVTASPGSLAPGTYTGLITVTGGGSTGTVAVTLTISGNERALLLSQTGLSFTAVAGGGVTPPLAFEILNPGRGVVNWSVTTSTLAGGAGWLNVTPNAGSTNAAANTVPSVQVRVNQAGLAAGVYYGLIQVAAPEAENSPQVVTVTLEVLAAGSDPGPAVEPSELVFTTPAGSSPGSKELFVYNIAQPLKTFRLKGELAGAVVVSLPRDATLELGQASRVVVQPFVADLAPGTYTGGLNLQFSDGRVRAVRIRVIVTGAGGSQAGRAAEGCAPTRLLPSILSVTPSVPITVGWPVPLTAEVRDDCGNPHEGGSVIVSFSNGDAPISLQSLKDGRWAGTWSSRGAATDQTTLKVEASNPERLLAGSQSLVVAVRSKQDPPVVPAAGVVSAAGVQSYAPLAPGAMITIYGQDLAEVTQAASSFPLPTQIGSTRIVIGGRELPLLFVSPGQINALVPSDITVNTRHQLLVRRASTYGLPVPLDVASAQPAIFTANLSGSGQGIIVDVNNRLNNPSNPARAGDTVILYASGLGMTNPTVAAGLATPNSPLSRVRDELTMTIGGTQAIVDFAGLAPGFGSLYQINARVPAGVQGDAVPVIVNTSGLSSPVVTMAIR